MEYFWLIPFLPLAGFLINGLFQKWLNEKSAGLIASAAVGTGSRTAGAERVTFLLPTGHRGTHRQGAIPHGSEWARLDSNQGPTDYESAALTS